MGVGNAQDFEQALDGAVLAAGTVEGVEGDVGFRLVSTVATSAPTSTRVTM